MARIFTSLLLLTVLILDHGGSAVPIPDGEGITLLLEALLQESYAEPRANQLAGQKFDTNSQESGNPRIHEMLVQNDEEQDTVRNMNWAGLEYLQQFIQQQEQRKSEQARAQEQYNLVHERTNLGGALMGYGERARQETGGEDALALLQHFIQRSYNQGVVSGRPDR